MRVYRTYLFLILFIVLMVPLLKAAESVPQETIPDQAIRLRILANSDSLPDQWLKQQVRNAIVSEMSSWVDQPKTREEARKMIQAHLPRFYQIAMQLVQQYGFAYPVQIQFGEVPFPTKIYGEKVYPAGQYEALLITLGQGKGSNWWCVLFPPLCFLDMDSGEAISQEELSSQKVYAAGKYDAIKLKPTKTIQVRFYLWDQLQAFYQRLKK